MDNMNDTRQQAIALLAAHGISYEDSRLKADAFHLLEHAFSTHLTYAEIIEHADRLGELA